MNLCQVFKKNSLKIKKKRRIKLKKKLNMMNSFLNDKYVYFVNNLKNNGSIKAPMYIYMTNSN